ncbi:erythronate-4-phosphate dehydrogenase [Fodinibius salinus]|uniref:Erythronate-4-phosphate dehydrogenase n=1 Tax=Fodinibius salinus TaxID=860790 RepID=A0A5D3YIQ2_9BACT|nr:4-phosphoerythronate dehydrogenase [Fodinibius salinus]TYP92615.1 erythronate-4-phosphate dehydrogenase [Fodinibius salinus]
MINVLADRYLRNITSYLPDTINLDCYDPGNGVPDLTDTDALLIRTVTDINKRTMPAIPKRLSFVGTGSAGIDHVDTDYLTQCGITFSNSAGCNARSVAEYVAVCLLYWSEQQEENVEQMTIGILGVGHVGTQVIKLLNNLNITTVAYDPPRAEREENFDSATLQQILQCDILSFHTPLTHSGEHPTYHWLAEDKLNNQQFSLIINAARGGVIDEQAVCNAMTEDRVGDIIIDVWEGEPQLQLSTANQAFIITPHIAGYSIQAKRNASKFMVDAMLDHFDLERPSHSEEPDPRIIDPDVSPPDSLSAILDELHPLKTYEKKLQQIILQNSQKRGKLFNKLRAEFPLRQEFNQIQIPASYIDKFPILGKLGFSLTADSK